MTEPIKIRVVEVARGVWKATIEGEAGASAYDGAPGQALANLIVAQLHRFGIESVLIASEVPEDPPGSADDREHSVPGPRPPGSVGPAARDEKSG